MIKVSELLSKQLIALNTAEIIGTISNIIFDSKLNYGRMLKIYNDDESDITTKYVELKKVKSLNSDAAVVSDKSHITAVWETSAGGIINPINRECFNQDGKYLGRVRDITLDGVRVINLAVDDKTFTPKELLSHSDKLLIFNDTGAPVKLSKVKTSVPKPAEASQVVKIHTEQPGRSLKQSEPVTVPSKVPENNTIVTRTPIEQKTGDTRYEFLTGKKLSRDLFSHDGKKVLSKGTVINDDIVSVAKQHNRLVQLVIYAE